MKKIYMFVMSVFAVYSMFPAYATTDIAADAENSECVENITGTYSGDANFKAKWAPNNIQLRWYNNNTLMQGVNTESNTCNYGTTLTIPTTPPERIGYIFDGWKIRPKMDFSTLTSLRNGSEIWARGYYNNNYYCWDRLSQTSCENNIFSDLEKHEWKVEFSSGTIYGSGHCSAKRGNNNDGQWNTAEAIATYDELENTAGVKRYCWCQVTGWKPSANNPDGIIYGQSSVSGAYTWVLYENSSSSGSCSFGCAARCAYNTFHYTPYRRALATGSGN